MQLGKPDSDGLDLNVALDAVFRRGASARPHALALADAPDRTAIAEGAARSLSYAEADRAIDGIAGQLRALGLSAGAVVAVQLPNIVEAPLTLLAVERAGLVAVPVPLAWRKSDLVRALGPLEPAAVITIGRAGEERPAKAACAAAAELFSLSFPCAFGSNLPDGVAPLTLDFDRRDSAAATTPSPGANSVSMLTFDATASGPFPVGRTHAEWVAAGLSTLMAARIAPHAEIVATLPPSTLAGIASAFVPWLLCGGTLRLANASTLAFGATEAEGAHFVAPATALSALLRHASQRFASIVAVHRGTPAPFDLGAQFGDVVDMHVFGEIGAIVRSRSDRTRCEPIPLGRVVSAGGAPPAVGIETRIGTDGLLMLRGAMVPHQARAHAGEVLKIEADGFVHTGYRCRAENAFELTVEAGPVGVATVGGLRFGLADLEQRIRGLALDAQLSYIPDAMLGGRVMIETDDPELTRAALEAGGMARLLLEAVALRAPAQRRAG